MGGVKGLVISGTQALPVSSSAPKGHVEMTEVAVAAQTLAHGIGSNLLKCFFKRHAYLSLS